ncbi:GTPase [Lyngbya aestuarii]|uniref:GTPase n=1 Tax=Lyngbya aestuarii TaxID=118322 RepID=UPI00403E261B
MTEQHDTDSPLADSQQVNKATDDNKAESVDNNSWTNRIADVWNDAAGRLKQILPVAQVAQTAIGWFSVSEAQLVEILATVRAELPTTEALLIGKPQAGKSSIVRGLTGVSAEIIGQGFRPHTQHTERYAYPSSDLPLLIFTDTVGLGDVNQDTQAIIGELVGDLQQKTRRARVLILTVKINDFATEALRQVAEQLRQQYPDIPCLLAVTCLHEVYPPSTVNHPAYPPDYEELNRAFTALEQAFSKLCDSAVLIDFTLEEDGYHPVFYGLEALRDSLADLLPEAEARAIYQLLDKEAGEQLGNLYRDVGRRYMLAFAIMAATLAAVPLPFATMPVLTALQVSMVGLLGQLYGQTLTPSQAGGVVSAIAGGFVAQAIGRELIKFIPGFGSVIAASWAAAYTWSLGEGACVYFGDLMGGKKPDPEKIQSVMQEAFQSAKERFKGIKHSRGDSPARDD